MDLEDTYAGIYIHIPFCLQKCGYCDFYSVTDRSSQSKFIEALLREIEISSTEWKHRQFDTIYFGGGTPSLLSVEDIKKIILSVKNYFEFPGDTEITLEANPGTIDKDKLKSFLQAGINRLSLGMQSFSDSELKFLGRIHSAENNFSAMAMAREAGFNNISIDLMAALPGQSAERLKDDLCEAFTLKPEHVSVYTLIFEPGTPFFKLRENGRIKPKNEEEEAEQYAMLTDIMEKNGYEMYEVSNFAISSNYYSRHNTKYWRYFPYLGLGPSAHSFDGTTRIGKVRSVKEYIDAVNNNEMPKDFSEKLSAKTKMEEFAFLGLRLKEGIDKIRFKKIFGRAFEEVFSGFFDKFDNSGLIINTGNNLRLTRKGLLLCDELSVYLNAEL